MRIITIFIVILFVWALAAIIQTLIGFEGFVTIFLCTIIIMQILF